MRLLCVLFCLMSSCFASDDLPKKPNVCGYMPSFNDWQAQVRASGSTLPDEDLEKWYSALQEAHTQLMQMLNGRCAPAPTVFEQIAVVINNQPPHQSAP